VEAVSATDDRQGWRFLPRLTQRASDVGTTLMMMMMVVVVMSFLWKMGIDATVWTRVLLRNMHTIVQPAQLTLVL